MKRGMAPILANPRSEYNPARVANYGTKRCRDVAPCATSSGR